MRKKTTKKAKAHASKASSTKAEPAVVAVTDTPSVPSSHSVNVAPLEMPPPDALLREAEEEPNYRSLASYCPVIDKLRRKGFSYREIAEWLTERGVEADHNAVYRVYMNSLSDHEAAMVDKEDEEEAMVDAYRNR